MWMLLKLVMISKTTSLSLHQRWLKDSSQCQLSQFLVTCVKVHFLQQVKPLQWRSLCLQFTIYNIRRTHTLCWYILLHDATDIPQTKCFVNCDIIVSWDGCSILLYYKKMGWDKQNIAWHNVSYAASAEKWNWLGFRSLKSEESETYESE